MMGIGFGVCVCCTFNLVIKASALFCCGCLFRFGVLVGVVGVLGPYVDIYWLWGSRSAIQCVPWRFDRLAKEWSCKITRQA